MADKHLAPVVHVKFSHEQLKALDEIVTKDGKFDHHPTDAHKAVAQMIHELAVAHPA